MKRKGFAVKGILMLLVALLCLNSVSVVGFAAETSDSNPGYSDTQNPGDNDDNKDPTPPVEPEVSIEKDDLHLAYGEIVPTDSNLKAQKHSYKFVGDECALYFMRLSKGDPKAYFTIEIYNDKNELIRSHSDNYDKNPGNNSLKVIWRFADLNSGKYHGKCYTTAFVTNKHGEEVETIDTSTINNFTIEVDRVSQKTVTINSLVNSARGPKLTWNKLPTGTRYNIYRREPGDKNWTRISNIFVDENSKSTKMSYIDTTAKSGKNYTYTIRCLDGKYWNKYNSKNPSIKYLEMPKITSVKGYGASGCAKITWNKIPGATSYRVYRRGGSLSNYDWEYIATVNSGSTTYFTDCNAKSSDWRYEYTVRAKNGKYISSYEENKNFFEYAQAPVIRKVSPYVGGMKIEWSANDPRIEKYTVYRKNGKKWSPIGTTTDKFFIDSGVANNKTYTYTVKALTETNAGAYNNKGVTAHFLESPTLENLSFDFKYRGVLEWKPVDGANGYKIYRKIADGKYWQYIATVKDGKASTYYDTISKKDNCTYTYTVRAFDKNNKLSYFDTKGISNTYLATPKVSASQIETQDGPLQIGIKWEPVDNAVSYILYKRIPGGKWHRLVSDTPETSYIDNDVICGVTYEYSVRALNEKGDVSAYKATPAFAMAHISLDSLSVTEKGVQLTWEKVKDVESYNIYRKAENSETWEKFANTKENVFIDASKEALTTKYSYAITIFTSNNESEKSNSLDNFTNNLTVTGKLDKILNTVTADWACDEAEKLIITKSVNGSEPTVVFEGVKGEEIYNGLFTDNTVTEGNSYVYTFTFVVPDKINAVMALVVDYPYDAIEKTELKAETVYSDKICISLTFAPVDLADSYEIYKQNGEEWDLIATVTEISEDGSFHYIDEAVEDNLTYNYKVKAVDTKSLRPQSESNIASAEVKIALDAPNNLTIEAKEAPETNALSFTLNWEEVKDADGYVIRRKAGDGEWVVIGLTNNLGEWVKTEAMPLQNADEKPVLPTSFVDDEVEANILYTYEVAAFAEFRNSQAASAEKIFEKEIPSEPIE